MSISVDRPHVWAKLQNTNDEDPRNWRPVMTLVWDMPGHTDVAVEIPLTPEQARDVTAHCVDVTDDDLFEYYLETLGLLDSDAPKAEAADDHA